MGHPAGLDLHHGQRVERPGSRGGRHYTVNSVSMEQVSPSGGARREDLRLDVLAGTSLYGVGVRRHVASALEQMDLAIASREQTRYTYTPASSHQTRLQGGRLQVGGLDLGALGRVDKVAGALPNCELMTVVPTQVEPQQGWPPFSVCPCGSEWARKWASSVWTSLTPRPLEAYDPPLIVISLQASCCFDRISGERCEDS